MNWDAITTAILRFLFYPAIILMFLAIGHLQVSVSPLYVRMPAWKMALGLFLMMVGLLFVIADSDRRAMNNIHQELEDELRKLKSETLKES